MTNINKQLTKNSIQHQQLDPLFISSTVKSNPLVKSLTNQSTPNHPTTTPSLTTLPTVESVSVKTDLSKIAPNSIGDKEIDFTTTEEEFIKRYTIPHFIIDSKTLHIPSKVELYLYCL